MDKKIEDKMPMDKKTDPQVFNYDMFSFRRIVLAPLLLIAGIVTIVVSIIRLPKEKKK